MMKCKMFLRTLDREETWQESAYLTMDLGPVKHGMRSVHDLISGPGFISGLSLINFVPRSLREVLVGCMHGCCLSFLEHVSCKRTDVLGCRGCADCRGGICGHC
jgi:hypothetical protein